MIHPGDKFKVHWRGREEYYEGRVYQVVNMIDNCKCSRSTWLTDLPKTSTREHYHIRAILVQPRDKISNKGPFVFDYIDPISLQIINTPGCWLEIVRQRGDQLSLF